MTGTIVGVLRGGPSHEHELSLRSGSNILANLSPERFTTRDIYIDKQGTWHDRGKRIPPQKILRQIDVALVTLQGEYGENGEVQRLLEQHGVPYTGANAFSSFLAMHKLMAKNHAEEIGLLTPEFRYVGRREEIETVVQDAVRSFIPPMVVKPVNWGSSLSAACVTGFIPTRTVVEVLFADGAQGVLIEESVRGREASVGVIENFRGEELYALPAVETVRSKEETSQSTGRHSHLQVPARFSRVIAEELARAAKLMHRTLSQRHYSQTDFIISPRGVYYLETNSLPALDSQSSFIEAVDAIGLPFPNFLTHVVEMARA